MEATIEATMDLTSMVFSGISLISLIILTSVSVFGVLENPTIIVLSLIPISSFLIVLFHLNFMWPYKVAIPAAVLFPFLSVIGLFALVMLYGGTGGNGTSNQDRTQNGQ